MTTYTYAKTAAAELQTQLVDHVATHDLDAAGLEHCDECANLSELIARAEDVASAEERQEARRLAFRRSFGFDR